MFFDTIQFGVSHFDLVEAGRHPAMMINSFIQKNYSVFDLVLNKGFTTILKQDNSYRPKKTSKNFIIKKYNYIIKCPNSHKIYITFRPDEGYTNTKKIKISADISKFGGLSQFHDSLENVSSSKEWKEIIKYSSINRLDLYLDTKINDFNYFKDSITYRYPRKEPTMKINTVTGRRTLYLGTSNFYIYEKMDCVRLETRLKGRSLILNRLGLTNYSRLVLTYKEKTTRLYIRMKKIKAFTANLIIREHPNPEKIKSLKIRESAKTIIDDLQSNYQAPLEKQTRVSFTNQDEGESDRDFQRRFITNDINNKHIPIPSYRKKDQGCDIHCNSLIWWSWELNANKNKFFSNNLAKSHFKKSENLVGLEYLENLKKHFEL